MKFLKLLLLFITINVNAQESRFKEGETIHIWASSGLNMRSKPDAKAEKIATIPYCAKVVVQPNIGVKIPFEVEEFKGFIVKGYWLLVKYGNTEGFVFDGFLSRLPAPLNNDSLGITEYFDKYVGKIGDKYEVKISESYTDSMRYVKPNEKLNFENYDQMSYKQKYKKNIDYSFLRGEGGFNETFEIPNMTIYEGYFLIKAFYYDQENDVFSFDKKDSSVNIKPKEEGAGCYYSIKKVGNKIVIDGGCGC